eukprot:CAMPEP_0168343182 /NCGR_PEP_ID=MMETSP0213-20121227/15901_1 /TAXON_ID=151035 /ORGANISM="Euplotes harpa, Strain FSP1.4" /LENGTH=207 /DNA_ID=CAMNT_0008350349 /DNA_START=8 /DNA_END=631 /DNA_ORIENTATION=-
MSRDILVDKISGDLSTLNYKQKHKLLGEYSMYIKAKPLYRLCFDKLYLPEKFDEMTKIAVGAKSTRSNFQAAASQINNKYSKLPVSILDTITEVNKSDSFVNVKERLYVQKTHSIQTLKNVSYGVALQMFCLYGYSFARRKFNMNVIRFTGLVASASWGYYFYLKKLWIERLSEQLTAKYANVMPAYDFTFNAKSVNQLEILHEDEE